MIVDRGEILKRKKKPSMRFQDEFATTGDHNRSLASPDITVRDVPSLLGLGIVWLGM